MKSVFQDQGQVLPGGLEVKPLRVLTSLRSGFNLQPTLISHKLEYLKSLYLEDLVLEDQGGGRTLILEAQYHP